MTTEKALIIAVTALAGVIVYLFKLYVSQGAELRKAESTSAKERESWAVERANHAKERALADADHKRECDEIASDHELEKRDLEIAFEKRWRELLERSDQASRRDSENFRAHEDQVRKEFAALMEKISAEAGKSTDALVQVMQRLYDRFVGPRSY